MNRLLIPYLFDESACTKSGFATRDDIDTAMRLGLAHPMGPLTLSNRPQFYTLLAIGEVLPRGLPRGVEVRTPEGPEKDLVAEGKLGRKSGGGFYDA